MRRTTALAALGLATRHAVGQQQQWQGFGAMPDLVKAPLYDAVARPPSLARRDGGCGANQHPCEQHLLSSSCAPPCVSHTNPSQPARQPGSDVNSTLCCPNTDYCIINETSLGVQCCELGLTCGEIGRAHV